MKITLLLIGTVCALSSIAQNKYSNVVLPKGKNLLSELLKESVQPAKQKIPFKPPVSLPKTKGYVLPNGNIVMSGGLGQMPYIIPNMKEYPNYFSVLSYKHKGLGKIPNVMEQ